MKKKSYICTHTGDPGGGAVGKASLMFMLGTAYVWLSFSPPLMKKYIFLKGWRRVTSTVVYATDFDI